MSPDRLTDLRRRPPRRRLRPFAVAFATAAVLLAIVIALGFHQTPSPARAASTAHAVHGAKEKKRVDHSGQYLKLAKKGIADARANWWNPGHGWFNDRLNDGDQFPLGTVWTMFPLWEAYSALAKVQPSSSPPSIKVTVFAVVEDFNNATRLALVMATPTKV